MRFLAFCVACLLTTSLFAAESAVAEKKSTKEAPAALDFKMETLGGKEIHLAEKYEGKVVLLVNVASRCGLTPQYDGLQALHEKYAEKGLAIVGVPCNQFGGQEPGDAEQIANFCSENYGVEFDMLAKVNVKKNKPDQAPLYKFLTSEETNPDFDGDIQWNFEKFLISRTGEVAGRFPPKVRPQSLKVTGAIEKELEKEPAK